MIRIVVAHYIRWVFIALTWGSLLSACGGAQLPLPDPYYLPSESEVDWSQPPAVKGQEIEFPPMPVTSFQLDSGLRVSVVEQPQSATTTLQLWVPQARGDYRGEVSLMVSALRAGTQFEPQVQLVNPRLSRREISSWVEPRGTGFRWTVLGRGSKAALKMLAAFIARPLFLKEETLSRVRQSLSTLQRYSQHRVFLEDQARGGVPGVDFPGNAMLAKMILNTTPAELARIHKCRMIPQGAALVVTGPIAAPQVEDWAREYFSGWQSTVDLNCNEHQVPAYEDEPPLERMEIFLRRNSSGEPNLKVMLRGPATTDPDYSAFFLMSRTIDSSQGGVASSMRHSGATYGLRASVNVGFPHLSILEISGTVKPARANRSLKQIVKTIGEYSSHVKGSGIAFVKRLAATSAMSRANTSSGVTSQVMFQLMQGHTPKDVWDGLRRLQATSVEDCRAAARKWLDQAKPVVLAIANPRLKVTEGLSPSARYHDLIMEDAD